MNDETTVLNGLSALGDSYSGENIASNDDGNTDAIQTIDVASKAVTEPAELVTQPVTAIIPPTITEVNTLVPFQDIPGASYCKIVWGKKYPVGNEWQKCPYQLDTPSGQHREQQLEAQRKAKEEKHKEDPTKNKLQTQWDIDQYDKTIDTGGTFYSGLEKGLHGAGIILGHGNIVALDVDNQEGCDRFLHYFGGLPQKYPSISWTSGKKFDKEYSEQTTAETCVQVAFLLTDAQAEKLKGRKVFNANSLDIRWKDAQSVLPSWSPHSDTKIPYRYLNSPVETTLAPMPDDVWVKMLADLDVVEKASEKPNKGGRPKKEKKEKEEKEASGGLHFREYQQVLDYMRSATEGTRNDTLNKVAFWLGLRGHFYHQNRWERYIKEIKQIAVEIGLNANEIETTVASGIEAGHNAEKKPRESNQHRVDYVQDSLEGRLRTNLRRMALEFDGKECDTRAIRLSLGKESCRISDYQVPLVKDAIIDYGMNHEYDPILEYLESLPIDEDTDILDNAATLFLENSTKEANRYLQVWLIQAVARVYQRGCKADSVLVLKADQGAAKTTFFQELVPDKKYYQCPTPGQSQVDELLAMHKAWINEYGEIENTFGRRGNSVLKAVISAQADEMRPPYGEVSRLYERGFVFAATTNLECILSDTTGSRRFLIVKAGNVDLDLVKKKRNQLWAQAVAAYKRDTPWWLTKAEEALLQLQNKEFEAHEPLEDKLFLIYVTWKNHYPERMMTSHTLLHYFLNIKADKGGETKLVFMLQNAGFQDLTKTRKRIGGKQLYVWGFDTGVSLFPLDMAYAFREKMDCCNITFPSKPEAITPGGYVQLNGTKMQVYHLEADKNIIWLHEPEQSRLKSKDYPLSDVEYVYPNNALDDVVF